MKPNFRNPCNAVAEKDATEIFMGRTDGPTDRLTDGLTDRLRSNSIPPLFLSGGIYLKKKRRCKSHEVWRVSINTIIFS